MTAPILEIGRRADGRPFVLSLGWHTLIAGLSGSGKSTTLRAALTVAAPLPDLAFVLVDVKRVESRPWRPRAGRVAVAAPEVLTVLRDAVTAMDARYELVDRAGAVDWRIEFGPRVLIVVDELAGVIATGTKRHDTEAISLLRQLLERGRACGYTLLLATQRPSADVIPTTIRDLCALRIAHATANVDSTRLILADAAESGPAHRLALNDRHRGQCYAMVDGDRSAILARSYYVTVAQAEHVAKRTARLNVDPWPAPIPVDTDAVRSGVLVGAGVTSTGSHLDRPATSWTEIPIPLESVGSSWPAPTTAPVQPALPGLDPDAVVLAALDRRGLTTAQLVEVVGLTRDVVVSACERLVSAGALSRGGDNRWRTP